jgi:hypothetical protein
VIAQRGAAAYHRLQPTLGNHERPLVNARR